MCCHAGWQTLSEAKARLLSLPTAVGFTFEAPATANESDALFVFFKSAGVGGNDDPSWRTFTRNLAGQPARQRVAPEGECVARRHADLGDGVRIPVRAFEGVPIAALEQAARIIESMCKHCAAPLKHRLSTSRCSIAVIGEDQVTTDIPDHAWLRGKSCGDGRDYDSGTRGLGGACWATACHGLI